MFQMLQQENTRRSPRSPPPLLLYAHIHHPCHENMLNYPEIQITFLSALQDSKTEDGGESAGEFSFFCNIKNSSVETNSGSPDLYLDIETFTS